MPTHINPLQPFLDQIKAQYPELLSVFERIFNPSDVGKHLALGFPSAAKRPPIPGFGPASALGESIASVGGGVGAAGLLLGLPGEAAGATAQANNAPTLGPTNEYGPFAPGGALSGITDFLSNSGVPSWGGASVSSPEPLAPPRVSSRQPSRVPRRRFRRPFRGLRGARPE